MVIVWKKVLIEWTLSKSLKYEFRKHLYTSAIAFHIVKDASAKNVILHPIKKQHNLNEHACIYIQIIWRFNCRQPTHIPCFGQLQCFWTSFRCCFFKVELEWCLTLEKWREMINWNRTCLNSLVHELHLTRGPSSYILPLSVTISCIHSVTFLISKYTPRRMCSKLILYNCQVCNKSRGARIKYRYHETFLEASPRFVQFLWNFGQK